MSSLPKNQRPSNGRPCLRGHTGPRYVTTNNCVQCLQERHAHTRSFKARALAVDFLPVSGDGRPRIRFKAAAGAVMGLRALGWVLESEDSRSGAAVFMVPAELPFGEAVGLLRALGVMS